MFITEKKFKGIKIIELNGRVDATADNFEQDLKDILNNETKIIIDCANLNYINSSGLRAFLKISKDVTQANARIIISNLNENIMEIFKISGFLDLFDVCDSMDEACSKLQ